MEINGNYQRELHGISFVDKALSKIKFSVNKHKNRLNTAEVKISKFKDLSIRTVKTERQKEK